MPEQRKYDFEAFLDDLREGAVGAKHDGKILEGLASKKALFSLVDDGNLDSLDSIELLGAVEERLQQRAGFDGFAIADDAFDNAKNVGDIYVAICKQAKIEPDFPQQSAAA